MCKCILQSLSCTAYFCAWVTQFALCLCYHPSQRVLTSSHACFWPLLIFLSPPSHFVLVALFLLGQCAAYKNNHTSSCLNLVSHLRWEGEAGILPREASPVSMWGPWPLCPQEHLWPLAGGMWTEKVAQLCFYQAHWPVSAANLPLTAGDQDDRAGPWTGMSQLTGTRWIRAFA